MPPRLYQLGALCQGLEGGRERDTVRLHLQRELGELGLLAHAGADQGGEHLLEHPGELVDLLFGNIFELRAPEGTVNLPRRQPEELREARGWSQARLSDESNVRQATISGLESGKIRRVQLDLLERLGKALAVDPASLLVSRRKR